MKNREKLSLNNCFLLQSTTHDDNRGTFREWYWGHEFPYPVAQGNVSSSKLGVIRGMHLNVGKSGQAKWVTCFSGQINDVIVDLRPDSSTFMSHQVINLNSKSGQILCIPSGIAHGFLSLEENTVVAYLVSSQYDPVNEVAINPLDESLGIDWGIKNPIISEKDRTAPNLANFLEKYSDSLRNYL